MEFSLVATGLKAMLRCAFLPWRALDIFHAYQKSASQGQGQAMLLAGLGLFFAAGLLRSVVFGGHAPLTVLIMMGLVVAIPMIFSYPGALVLAGISAGVDGVLLTLSLMGWNVPHWFDGIWELAALVVAYFYVWRSKRDLSSAP